MVFNYQIKENIDVKSFLLKQFYSNRIINQLFLCKNKILVNDKTYSDFNLKVGDRLTIILEEISNVLPSDKEIEIAYENEFFIVVNKPKGLSTIPSKRYYEDNLAGRIQNYYLNNNIKAGIHAVNRLDFLTSGLVIFAKSQYIHSLFSKTDIVKKYRCTVKGILNNKSGIIDKRIARESENAIKRTVCYNGQKAITKYKVIEEINGNSKLDIELLTGRTHQIRVHLSSIGHSLVGDTLYGDGVGDFDLCSYYLAFNFLLNNKEYIFEI